MFQLIKDSCGTRKFLKKNSHILLEKGSLPNRKSTCQKEVNNKIHIACSEPYRKSFPNSDSFNNLPQQKQIPLESSGKVSAQYHGWIWSYAQ
jgi:hypothetical protein